MELYGDPSVDVLPHVACRTCGKRTGKYHESFIAHITESSDPNAAENYFNKNRIKKRCCRADIAHPVVVPVGRSLYNEEMVRGRKDIKASARSGPMPERPVLTRPGEGKKFDPVKVINVGDGSENLITTTGKTRRGIPVRSKMGGFTARNVTFGSATSTPSGSPSKFPAAALPVQSQYTMTEGDNTYNYRLATNVPQTSGCYVPRLIPVSSTPTTSTSSPAPTPQPATPATQTPNVFPTNTSDTMSALPIAQSTTVKEEAKAMECSPEDDPLMGITGCIVPTLRKTEKGGEEIDPNDRIIYDAIYDALGQALEPRVFTGRYRDVGCGLRVPILTGAYLTSPHPNPKEHPLIKKRKATTEVAAPVTATPPSSPPQLPIVNSELTVNLGNINIG